MKAECANKICRRICHQKLSCHNEVLQRMEERSDIAIQAAFTPDVRE